MSYPEPRAVVVTWAESQSLTVLEQARACVLAGIKPSDAERLMRAYASGEAEPEELLTGATLIYAVAYELELRREPGATWEEAQRWRVSIDTTARDPMADAEAHAAVEASLATGLPPDEAGQLTMAHLAAYRDVRSEAERETRRRRKRRAG